MRTKSKWPLSRRDWLRLSSLGVVGAAQAHWFEALAAEAAADPARRRSCILLWMSGGPSQIDTFDPKPGHANGGTFKDIATRSPGVRISEHLPKLAEQSEHLAIVRSLTSKEGDHARATQFVHTGYLPQGPIRYPTLGSLVSKELGSTGAELPNFVSVAPFRGLAPAAHSPGFLGSPYAPLLVGTRGGGGEGSVDEALKVDDLELPGGVDLALADTRLGFAPLAQRSLRRPARRRPRAGPRHGLRPGGQADAQRRRPGLQSRRGAGRRSRRLRPQSIRTGLPARPPAGRTGGPLHRGGARRRARAISSAGTRTPTISRGSENSARRSIRPGRR